MVCAGDGSLGLQEGPWLFRNWARTSTISVPEWIRPSTVEQVVAAVQRAERDGRVIKAMGSGWSYPGAAVTAEVSHVLDTRALAGVLSGTDPAAGTLIPRALNDAGRARRRYLVHVQAGITLHALNCALDGRGLALHTLGGSSGQTLAGAVSTGTHGGDVDRPPLADAVRAIHLVGPGGQEWWIEPAAPRSVTDPARMEEARASGLLCADTRIEYDDRLFRAVLVSLGRMGIVCGYVIEAVDAVRLRETRSRKQWAEVSGRIRRDVVDAGEAYAGPRYMEVVVSPYRDAAGDHQCVVTERDVTTEDLTAEGPAGADPFTLFCDLGPLTPMLGALAATLPVIIATVTAAAVASVSWMAGIPFIGGVAFGIASGLAITAATGALVALETALLALLASPGENPGAKLASLCNLAAAAGQKSLVRDLVNAMVGVIRDPAAPSLVMESYRFAGQRRCPAAHQDDPACMREIDGVEFALDATPGHDNLFRFMDDVFALTDEFYDAGRPPGFGLSLRFSRGTTALLGMQQYARTCHVEFLMMRGIAGHDEFRRRLYAVARTHGGIPHWGLVHEVDGREVYARYGDNFTHWRLSLARLIDEGGGRAGTFSTAFSLARDLEPLRGCLVPAPLVDLFRDALVALAERRAARVRRPPPEISPGPI